MGNNFSYLFYSSTISAWEGMYRSVLGATKSIYWEIYIFIDDEAGNRFIDLLCEKANQGVDVKIIVDGIGSLDLSQLAIKRLRFCGVEVLIFNPLYPDVRRIRKWWNKVWLRTHCKVLLIDEEIAFIGGVNVQSTMENWDDLHLKISGRVIRPLLRNFGKKYVATG